MSKDTPKPTLGSKAKIGDWVRFYVNGELKIGVIEYINVQPYKTDRELLTNLGSVSDSRVLEVRSK